MGVGDGFEREMLFFMGFRTSRYMDWKFLTESGGLKLDVGFTLSFWLML